MNKEVPREEDLKALYIDCGLSMKEIGEKMGMSVGKVYKYTHLYGIPSRERYKGFLGKHHSEEAKKKISSFHKGKVVSLETKRKISESRKMNGSGHKKMRDDGYVAVYYPSHPMSRKDGYVMEHRLIMEAHIGRFIERNEVVHHINHIRSDNRLENLQLMSFQEHAGLHMKERWQEKRRRG